MSVEIKYKGNTIASASTDTTKTLKTSGKYCEADIEVINTPDGGGGIDVKSAARCEIVTVGANTVTNPVEAVSYFGYSATYPGLAIILLDTLNSDDQFGFIATKKGVTQSGASGSPWWRWRSGSFNWPGTFNSSWSAYLVEGTKYLVIEW